MSSQKGDGDSPGETIVIGAAAAGKPTDRVPVRRAAERIEEPRSRNFCGVLLGIKERGKSQGRAPPRPCSYCWPSFLLANFTNWAAFLRFLRTSIVVLPKE